MLKNRALGAALLLLSFSSLAYGHSKSGTIQGTTRGPAGLPLAKVHVVVHSVEQNTDLSLITSDQGTFVAENLRPGHYYLTASKEGLKLVGFGRIGFQGRSETTVELAAQQTLRVDMTLASPSGSKGSSGSALPPAPASPSVNSTGVGASTPSTAPAALAAGSHGQSVAQNSDNAPITEREKQLLDRVNRLEERLAAMEAKEGTGSVQTASTATQPLLASKESTGFAQTASTATQPLLASLEPVAVLPPPGKPQELPSGTPATAKPSQTSSGDTASQSLVEGKPVEPKPEKPAASEPFAYADWTWLNGNPRTKDSPLQFGKYFTGEFRADTHYMVDFNHPRDDTIGGSTESFRSDEVQVEQLSFGGDIHVGNARGRFLTMNGLFATTTPRNDASPARGQWQLQDAYRYVSEAWGGYHFNVNHGLNIDAGIFVSYIGLFSYYNFDNWTYQPSFVSSNTPWFFNGIRVQWFPTDKLKIEPWFINGWQSYGRYNSTPGLGGQILWRPKPWVSMVFNNYGMGQDTLGVPRRYRIHTDDSIEVKYFDREGAKGLDRMAFSLTGDLGCEYGAGVSCTGDHSGGPKQSFAGYMLYNRFWFHKDLFGLTIGGGKMDNPGRYLVLLPPINGATAITGSPYFTTGPGLPYHGKDSTVTFDYMPSQYVTFRWEVGWRYADVPYWTGRGGITPPGYNNGSPQDYVCSSGASSGQTVLSAAETACGGGPNSVWFPSLRNSQSVATFALLVKF
jgi:hypothetical protein